MVAPLTDKKQFQYYLLHQFKILKFLLIDQLIYNLYFILMYIFANIFNILLIELFISFLLIR